MMLTLTRRVLREVLRVGGILGVVRMGVCPMTVSTGLTIERRLLQGDVQALPKEPIQRTIHAITG